MREETPLSDELISPVLHLMQALRACGGGDLDLNIILLAVGERSLAHPEFRRMTREQRMAWDQPALPTRGVNARSIADSTGMPRESVRRKVTKLIRAGLIARSPDGLAFTPEGYRTLQPARAEIEQLARKAHEVLLERASHEA